MSPVYEGVGVDLTEIRKLSISRGKPINTVQVVNKSPVQTFLGSATCVEEDYTDLNFDFLSLLGTCKCMYVGSCLIR